MVLAPDVAPAQLPSLLVPVSVVAEPMVSVPTPLATLAAAMACDSVHVVSLMFGYERLSLTVIVPACATLAAKNAAATRGDFDSAAMVFP